MSEMTVYDYDDIQVIPLGPPGIVPPVASFNTVSLLTQSLSTSGAILTIDRALGEWVTLQLTNDVTSIVVNNWPPPGNLGRVHLDIFNQGSYQILGWPPGSAAPYAGLPQLTPNGNDLIIMTSVDGGATTKIHIVGLNYMPLEG
jgi:hypothetical protein